jgi:hypothetical protein
MRLIDADANIETMKKCAENPENEQALLCYRYTQRILEESPTVEPASPWRRVEDELPKPNRNVLWWCEIRGMGHIRMGQYEGATNHGTPEVSCCGPACKPLYWMPLPEPPKEDADGNK